MAAVVQIAFAGWPSDGLARSTHWADEVVTLGDVPYSARRVAISTLGEMAAEGVTLSDQTHGEAFAADPLLRREFGTAAAELIGAYRWRQPYMSAYCPSDGDQRQMMADRLVNIASQILFNYAPLRDNDALLCAAIDDLVMPILRSVPAQLPASWAGDTPAERTRASRAMRKARANAFDHFVVRPLPPEAIAMARMCGQTLPSSSISEIDDEDVMADGLGRMLAAVMQHTAGSPRYRSRPLEAPWVAGVLAAGAAPTLAALLPTPTEALLADQMTAMSTKAHAYWVALAARAGPQVGSSSSPTAPPMSARAPGEAEAGATPSSIISPWVGARVTLAGLAARPELNGRVGVVDGRKNAERWLVQLVTPDGMRDGSAIALKPSNLVVATPPPPAAAAEGTCLEVGPAPLAAARDAISVRVAPEPLPVSGADIEAREKEILRTSRGWRRVLGLKAYTKDGTYPDLYCYFDAADTTSATNHWAMRAFTAYPQDIGGLPPHGIRGNVIAIRALPPTAVGPLVAPGAGALYHPQIGVEEMRDTLLYYLERDAAAVARERDMQRTMAGMPPEMAAMMGGVAPVDLGMFRMP